MKKRTLALLLSTLCVSALGGCNDNGGNVTLTYWCFNDQVSSFERRFESFTAETGINVSVQGIQASTWAEVTTELVNAAVADTLPDVADMASESMASLVSAGLVEDIDSLLERDMAEMQSSIDQMDPKLYNAHVYGGKRYSLPTIWNAPIMFYNKNVLKNAGINTDNVHYPHKGWTIEDFKYCCNQITKNNTKNGANNKYGFKVENQYFYSIEPWLNAYNTSVLNSDWTASTIASQPAKDCFQMLYGLLNDEDYSKVASPQLGGTNSFELFYSNRVGFMALSLPYVFNLYNSGFNESENDVTRLQAGYDVITFPSIDGLSRTLMGVGATAIFKNSQHKEEAWKLAKYLSSKEYQETQLTQTVWAIPAINSAARILEGKDYFPQNGGIFREALQNASYVPAPAKYTSIELEVRKWFSGYVSKTTGFTIDGDGKNSLNKLAQTIDTYLR